MDSSNQKHYEKYLEESPDGTFFQSWAFGEFQESIPYRGFAQALYIGDARGTSTCLAIRQKIRFGKCWLWVPYGPIGGFRTELFLDLEDVAHKQGAIFARIEPGKGWAATDTAEVAKHWRVQPSKQRFTAEHSLILDLSLNEEELLAQMKPKGRYNINIARKHGINIVKSDCEFEPGHEADIDIFFELIQKTAERDEFGIHPKSFYKNLLGILGPQKMASLFLAYASDTSGANGGAKKPVAGLIAVYYKDIATYYFGASDHAYRNLMAPYLLQWEAIKDAKMQGYKKYDFLGIAPPGADKHPWAGLSEFKKKFGGREISYRPAFDIIYKPLWYKGLNTAASLRGRT